MPPRLTLALRSLLSATLARATRPASNVAKKAPIKRTVKPKAQPILDEYGTERKPLPPLSLGKDKAGAGLASRSTPLEKVDAAPRRAPSASRKAHESALLDAPADLLPSEPSAKFDPLSLSTLSILEASVRRDLARFPDCLLLTQVGSFYESYFEQAPLVARLTGIKLTSKQFGKGDAKRWQAFCGFPLAQLAQHMSTLVEAGHRVVIVDEYKDAGAEITRRVSRVVTPGTGVDEGFVKQDRMNFVLAIGLVDAEGALDLAWRDVSTGAYFTRNSSLASLRDDMLLVEPKEVVVSSDLASTRAGESLLAVLRAEEEREPWLISLSKSSTSTSSAQDILGSYLASTLVATPPPETAPTLIDPSKLLQMDSTTLKSLEIRESLRGGVRGSLVSTVRRTVTPGGSRLLTERLCAPSTELSVINYRLSLVSSFVTLSGTRQYLRALLKPLPDSSRLLQRLFLRRGKAFDLASLKRIVQAVSEARRTLEDEFDDGVVGDELEALRALVARMGEHGTLVAEIEQAIDEVALEKRLLRAERKAGLEEALGAGAVDKMDEDDGEGYTEGLWGKDEEWVVKPAFTPALAALHNKLTTLRQSAKELERSLQEEYELPSLTLKIVPKYGPAAHVQLKAKSATDKIDADPAATVLTRSGSTRSYSIGAWTVICAQIKDAVKVIEKLESDTISNLVQQVVDNYESLHETTAALDELDLSLAFAELALEMELVRPAVNDGTSLTIIAGRHPTVQHALKMKGRPFITNSVHFSHPGAFVHCLTGPNMAGKSTFLRQNALIVILAQAGSFVPADSVEMGLVDRVFSRVGARDELDRDRSTFFIEMDEATSILRTATDRSLVLLDELGRGTSPLDGLAIAYAALEHLVNVNRSRTLFATHYHRLGELMGYNEANPRGEGAWEGVEFWCTDVHERKDSVSYSHALRRGLNTDSAGIIIARLAGMPQRAIKVAQELRARYLPRTS